MSRREVNHDAMLLSRQWWQLLPSLLVVIGITYLSLIKEVPFADMGDIPLADKWGHAVAYMVLALCLAFDLHRMHAGVRVVYIVSILTPIIYGGLMEWMQYYFPPRMCDRVDWIADIIGTAAGVILYALLQLLRNKPR